MGLKCEMRITADGCYSKQFQRLLAKQGLKFKLNTKVTSAEKKDGKVVLAIEGAKDGKSDSVSSKVITNHVALADIPPA